MELRTKIETAINSVSVEKGSNTPDFILAEYLTDSLAAFDKAVKAREKWYGRDGNAGPCGNLTSSSESQTTVLPETHPPTPVEIESSDQLQNLPLDPKFLFYIFKWDGFKHTIAWTYPLTHPLGTEFDIQSDPATLSRPDIAEKVDEWLVKITERMGQSAVFYYTTMILRDNVFTFDGPFPTLNVATEWVSMIMFSPPKAYI